MNDAKTVVRANFARDYSGIPIYSGQFGTQGFNQYATFLSPDSQLQPALTLRNGVPPPATPSARSAAGCGQQHHRGSDRHVATACPLINRLSLSIEREFPASTIVTVGFSYSGGKNLLVGNGAANPNAIPLADLQYGDRVEQSGVQSVAAARIRSIRASICTASIRWGATSATPAMCAWRSARPAGFR